jgi:hypothetical protein
MELLIPGLILVALMVWASTKIKKTAADAFKEEQIDTGAYSLRKPEGFLHVIGDEHHELMAYSREYGKGDSTGVRQATIELDILHDSSLENAIESIQQSAISSELTSRSEIEAELNTEETANESTVSAVYRIVATRDRVYRLRFAVLPEHKDDYLRRIDETFESFTIKHA